MVKFGGNMRRVCSWTYTTNVFGDIKEEIEKRDQALLQYTFFEKYVDIVKTEKGLTFSIDVPIQYYLDSHRCVVLSQYLQNYAINKAYNQKDKKSFEAWQCFASELKNYVYLANLRAKNLSKSGKLETHEIQEIMFVDDKHREMVDKRITIERKYQTKLLFGDDLVKKPEVVSVKILDRCLGE